MILCSWEDFSPEPLANSRKRPQGALERHSKEKRCSCRNSALLHNCIRYLAPRVAPAVFLGVQTLSSTQAASPFPTWPANDWSAPRQAFCAAFHGIRLGRIHGPRALCSRGRRAVARFPRVLAALCSTWSRGWCGTRNAPIHSRSTSGSRSSSLGEGFCYHRG
jgi:hypothetical protein